MHMQRKSGPRTFLSTSLAAVVLVACAGAAAAMGPDAGTDGAKDKEKKVEKHRVVVINENGHERVIEGDGPLVRRGYLGVGLTEMTPELRTHFGAPENSGVMVSHVEPGGPAERAGIKVGDIISEIDGKDVATSWELGAKVRELDDNQQVPLEIWRGGKVQTMTAAIQLRERPELDMGPLFIRRGSKEGGDVLLHLNSDGGPGLFKMAAPDGHPMQLQRLRSPREAELEKKVQDLEKRLDDLEKQLKQRK
jgi:membrane-associated protease RseP (regulator of RpoE activity)